MNSRFTFSTCLVTLLKFYRTGDSQTFRIILKRTIEYLKFSLNENDFKTLCNIIFDRLITFGILERLNLKGRTIWEFCGTSIIHIGDSKHLFIGDQPFINEVLKMYDQQIVEHCIYDIQDKYLGGIHSIVFPQIHSTKNEIKNVHILEDTNYIDIKETKLYGLLPNIEEVKSTLLSEQGYLVPENHSLSIFDFNQIDWIPSHKKTIAEPGYYRIANHFGKKVYVINKNENETFRLPEKDWAYFLACYLLMKKIPLNYQSDTNSLTLQYLHFRNFPFLIKRALTIEAFTWPKFKKGMYHILGIKKDSFAILIKKMKIFKVLN